MKKVIGKQVESGNRWADREKVKVMSSQVLIPRCHTYSLPPEGFCHLYHYDQHHRHHCDHDQEAPHTINKANPIKIAIIINRTKHKAANIRFPSK